MLGTVTVPVARSFTPHGDIEHLQHSLFLIGKLIKIHVHKSRQNIKQKGNPAARINHSKAVSSNVSLKSSFTPVHMKARKAHERTTPRLRHDGKGGNYIFTKNGKASWRFPVLFANYFFFVAATSSASNFSWRRMASSTAV